MAKSTMHHPKAMATHIFSLRCAGFHQMPRGLSSPVWVSVCMAASGQGGLREAGHFVQPPAGVDHEHDDNARDQPEEEVVEETLAGGNRIRRIGWGRRRGHVITPGEGTDSRRDMLYLT
jgi:hypothetical protein